LDEFLDLMFPAKEVIDPNDVVEVYDVRYRHLTSGAAGARE
jgi:hypothetical protein